MISHCAMLEKESLETEKIWQLLEEVPDPEIPVISVVELGVVRDVIPGEEIIIKITPTYSGCPAMKAFEDDIIAHLNKNGYPKVKVEMTYTPAWTTDWMSEEAMEKLRKFGIAPPVKGTADKGVLFKEGPKVVKCPRCGSEHTHLESQFGSTACKALYKCDDCLEPFDYFKCI